MQLCNVMLALDGDTGNTVPKYGVTVSEIAVLRALHGAESVFDVEPLGDARISQRDERERLLARYGKFHDGRDTSPVSALFPGAAARMFEKITELDLPEEFFKAKARVKADEIVDEADEEIVAPKPRRKAPRAAAAPEPEVVDVLE